jgi:hypothetical protein
VNVTALAVAELLGVSLLAAYIMVLIGIRREDKALNLRSRPDEASAALARKVTGCYVRVGGLMDIANTSHTNAGAACASQEERLSGAKVCRGRGFGSTGRDG